MRRLKTTFWGEGGGIYCCTITIFYHILIVTHILLKIFRTLIIIIGREIVTPRFYLNETKYSRLRLYHELRLIKGTKTDLREKYKLSSLDNILQKGWTDRYRLPLLELPTEPKKRIILKVRVMFICE